MTSKFSTNASKKVSKVRFRKKQHLVFSDRYDSYVIYLLAGPRMENRAKQ